MEAPDKRLEPALRLIGYFGYAIGPTAMIACIATAALLMPLGAPVALIGGVVIGLLVFQALDAFVKRVVMPRVYAHYMGGQARTSDAALR